MFKLFPKYFKLVERPADVSVTELAKAQPVYIDGLPSGGAGDHTHPISEVTGLEARLTDLETRLATLEGA